MRKLRSLPFRALKNSTHAQDVANHYGREAGDSGSHFPSDVADQRQSPGTSQEDKKLPEVVYRKGRRIQKP